MLISIAIPCYNSSKTLRTVVTEIKDVFRQKIGYDYQIILVNDNSPDKTYDVIRSLCAEDRRIIGVDLSKNYGQISAQMAAIRFIKGEVAVFMDDDGQHAPADLFQLVDKVLDGSDLVFASFGKKQHSFLKKATSAMNAKLLEMTNRKPKGITISSFFALSRTAVDSLKDYKSPYPSICGYLLQITSKISNVELQHRDRLAGHSNYSLSKLVKLFLQGFTNFSIVPLRVSSFIGIFSAFIGFIIGIYYIIRRLFIPGTVSGFTANISATLFIGGLIMLMLGMLGEYIGRIYILLSDMPQYNIRETINEDKNGTKEK
ncbi:MAG: glycosyltransferase family 2 protein [Eubacterium sp.]|nr:glycosyltransferase family 2 protein [Eubacterium sp.]